MRSSVPLLVAAVVFGSCVRQTPTPKQAQSSTRPFIRNAVLGAVGRRGGAPPRRRAARKRAQRAALWCARMEVRPTAWCWATGVGSEAGLTHHRSAGCAVAEPHRVVSQRQLLQRMWPGMVVGENNLQVQVATLRRRVGQDTRHVNRRGAVDIDAVRIGTDGVAERVRATAPKPSTAFARSAPHRWRSIPSARRRLRRSDAKRGRRPVRKVTGNEGRLA